MTAGRCIRRKAQAGRVDRARAEAAAGLFDEMETELRAQNAPRASQLAAERTLSAVERQTRRRRRASLQQVKAQLELASRIRGAPDNPIEAALGTLDFDPRRKTAGLNAKMLSEAIRGQAHARLVELMDRFGSKAAGLDVAVPGVRARRRAGLRDVVRQLFGEQTGSAEARQVADGVAGAFEHLRQLFNASGGDIPKRADWGLPQSHSRRLVASVTEDDWLDFILPRLDRDKMVDFDTGQSFTETRLRRLAGEIYRDIVTDGLADVKPGGAVGRNISLRRAQSRFFVFRDADAWLEYQNAFGEGDVFQTILAHINGMSRDIALMRIYGPQPEASLRFVEQLVGEAQGRRALEGTGPAAARDAGRLAQGRPRIRDLYNTVTGQIYQPANQFWANVSAANRNIVTSAMLGGAVFSALADRTFTRITANLNGVPAGRTLVRMMRLYNPASAADRRLAQRAGFVNDIAMGSAIGQARYFGEVVGPEWSRKISDVTLRLTQLSPWTTWGRVGFGVEFLGHISDQVGRGFDDLEVPTRRAFDAYGIGRDDWGIIRNTPLFRDEPTGAEILRPQDIVGTVEDAGPLFDRHFDAAVKLQAMILTEADFAVPSTTARSIALITAGKQPGTFAGEVFRNTFLFKAFPITLLMTHLRRAAFGSLTGRERAKMIAHLVIGTAIMGTLGEQLSQITKGKDPLPLDPTTDAGRKSWLKGLARGGGLGIFGDFIFQDQNRFGGGIINTLSGPVFGSEVPELTRLTVGNLQELIEKGEATNAGREFVRFTKLMLPGRSAWFSTLAMERLIFDEIQKAVDPNYARSFAEIERRARREFGQSFFSPPGSGFPPRRGPELERALR